MMYLMKTVRKTTRGGKISLTSTGDTGKITLGAGVDYNGDATDGTLAAASAKQGAVVIDAQGSQGALVNNTTGTNAITTGKDVTTDKYGTWQVYSASPDNNTLEPILIVERMPSGLPNRLLTPLPRKTNMARLPTTIPILAATSSSSRRLR